MKIEDGIPPTVLRIATDMLKKYIPDLTASVLVDCIEKYNRPECVTIAKACELLSVGRTKIWKLRNAGKLHPIHIGNEVRIRYDEIEFLLNCGTD